VLEWVDKKGQPFRLAPSYDREGSMDRRTPLQHLLHNLLPSRGKTAASAQEFLDTRPEPAVRQVAPPYRPWAESAVDLALGTDIMEYPEGTTADLMDEFFAKAEKRAA